MRKTISALVAFAAFGAFSAPTVSYKAATNIAEAVHEQLSPVAIRFCKVADYLYEADYVDIDYKTISAWYAKEYGDFGGCLSFRSHGFHARNYDWKYDRAAETVVRVSSTATRHGSIGIAHVGMHMTEEMASKGMVPDEIMRVLPGRVVDGINDAGVAINVNVVHATGDEPSKWHGTACPAQGAIRHVLDNCTNAFDAATWIVQNVYIPPKFVTEQGYSFHWMVSDERETYIVEDGAKHLIVDADPSNPSAEHWYFDPVMSNYRLYRTSLSGAEFNRNIVGTYDPYGSGIERSDLARAKIGGVADADGAFSVLSNVWYSQSYIPHPAADPFWYTEFTFEPGGISMLSPDAQLHTVAETQTQNYMLDHATGTVSERGGRTWQTVHSAVYCLTNRTLTVAVQESAEKLYEFPLVGSGGSGGTNADDVKKIIAKTDVRDYPHPEGDSVLERVTNADVGLVVTNGILMVVDRTNVVWESESESITNQFGQVKDTFRQFTNEFHRVETKMLTYNDFLGGSNVVFEITNYVSGAYSTDHTKFGIRELREVAPGVTNYVPIYESRTDITNHLGRFRLDVIDNPTNGVAASIISLSNGVNVVSNYLEQVKADKAWGKYASDGAAAPSNTVVIRARSTVFAGGYAFDRVNIGAGTIGVLVNKGAAAYTGEPGTFRFRDAMSGEYFGYVKNNYTIGVNTDGISHIAVTNTSGTIVGYLVKLTFNVTMSGYPIIKYMPDMDDYNPDEWEQLNYATGDPVPGASHVVTWEDPDPKPGQKVCWINVGMEPQGFFTAVIGGVDGQSVFVTNMTIDPKGGFVAVDSVNTNATYTIEPYVDVGVVKWRVKN